MPAHLTQALVAKMSGIADPKIALSGNRPWRETVKLCRAHCTHGVGIPSIPAPARHSPPGGITAYVWTDNIAAAHALARELRPGSVKINGSGMEFTLPFGGFKLSGLGRENGREGVLAFTDIRSVMIGWREKRALSNAPIGAGTSVR